MRMGLSWCFNNKSFPQKSAASFGEGYNGSIVMLLLLSFKKNFTG